MTPPLPPLPPTAIGRPLLVFLHGFPSSSYDFVPLLAALGDPDALSFDFLGFGLSEKPRDHTYSLLWQADLAEQLVARHGGGRPVLLVAHDMGTSVATELLARDVAGRLGFELAGALLFNGSIVLDRARLTWVQRLLRSPLGPLAARLSSEQLFRRQFSGLFSEQHPIGETELADQWALLSASGGGLARRSARLLPRRAPALRGPLVRGDHVLVGAALVRLGNARSGRHAAGAGGAARAPSRRRRSASSPSSVTTPRSRLLRGLLQPFGMRLRRCYSCAPAKPE